MSRARRSLVSARPQGEGHEAQVCDQATAHWSLLTALGRPSSTLCSRQYGPVQGVKECCDTSGCFLKRTLKHFLEHSLIKNPTAASTRAGCYARHRELLLGNAKSRQTFPVRASYQAQRSAPLIFQKILDLTFKPVLPFQTNSINDHLFPILPYLCRESDTHAPNTICVSFYP